MSSRDWFRKTTWTDADAADFFRRLGRTRSSFAKAQYLRIQAHHLAESKEPSLKTIALDLLDKLLKEFPDEQSQLALALHQKAAILCDFRQISESIAVYRLALEQERQYPGVGTRAWLDFPWMIATEGITDLYSEAESIMNANEARAMFPVDHYMLHGARALIAEGRSDKIEAAHHARLAMEAASREHSGFRHHPSLGLVRSTDSPAYHRLQKLHHAGRS